MHSKCLSQLQPQYLKVWPFFLPSRKNTRYTLCGCCTQLGEEGKPQGCINPTMKGNQR
uniref:Uncharacterized protein n=1 Tax=Glycine max TaxID=3847 RepID=C6T138_SOYBN|nr:unknown [Glycine max]